MWLSCYILMSRVATIYGHASTRHPASIFTRQGDGKPSNIAWRSGPSKWMLPSQVIGRGTCYINCIQIYCCLGVYAIVSTHIQRGKSCSWSPHYLTSRTNCVAVDSLGSIVQRHLFSEPTSSGLWCTVGCYTLILLSRLQRTIQVSILTRPNLGNKAKDGRNVDNPATVTSGM